MFNLCVTRSLVDGQINILKNPVKNKIKQNPRIKHQTSNERCDDDGAWCGGVGGV